MWQEIKEVERLQPLYEQHAASQLDLDNALASLGDAEAVSYTHLTSSTRDVVGILTYRQDYNKQIEILSKRYKTKSTTKSLILAQDER